MNKRKDIAPNKLKDYRVKAGLTQKQVAEKLGMQCEDRISHWEKGTALPNIKNLFKLSKIYKMPVKKIMNHFIN